jgi:polysaccharide pyruvyl transferase WcaK-like protein
MKLFFVGDNRTSFNLGRGASIALRNTLSGPFEIGGCIAGDFFDLSVAEAGYVHTLMPSRFYRHFRYLLERRKRPLVSWYIKLEQLWGAHDFISKDPKISVDNLLTEKHRYPALSRIYEEAMAADVFVVDGDGDIIFSTPPRRSTLFLLAMVELGLRLGKPVFLVNSMISDCPVTGRNSETLDKARSLFARCEAVALRDYESLRYINAEIPQANASFIPDSLFSWFSRYEGPGCWLPKDGDFILPHPEKAEYWGKLDFSQPYICIGGGALASWYPDKAVECYGRLVDAAGKLGLRTYLMECDLPDSFLQRVAAKMQVGIVPSNAPILLCGAVLANARLFISGRYHPSILASLGGTPCIFLGSHAHKMSSLPEVLNYEANQEFDALPSNAEIGEILALAQSYLEQGETLRDRIRNVAKMRADQASDLPSFLRQHLHVSLN